jgi:hypothetical protein
MAKTPNLTVDMFADWFNDASTYEAIDQDATGRDPNGHRSKNAPCKWLQEIVDNDYLAFLKRRLIAGESLREIDYHLCQCSDIWLDEDGNLQFGN